MNLVTLDHIHKQYSERLLLEDAGLVINRGDRIGLIGINGSGKTTLLRIVAGLEPADAGPGHGVGQRAHPLSAPRAGLG